MQFDHALDRLLRKILLADPKFSPVELMKVDMSDGFYRVGLNIDDIPKLGVAFPTQPGEEQLVALPLVLPMGWKNSPPVFSAVTETIADLANQRIEAGAEPPRHHLDEAAEATPVSNPLTEALTAPSVTTAEHEPAVAPRPGATPSGTAQCQPSLPIPTERDPSLPSQARPLRYIDIFDLLS